MENLRLDMRKGQRERKGKKEKQTEQESEREIEKDNTERLHDVTNF